MRIAKEYLEIKYKKFMNTEDLQSDIFNDIIETVVKGIHSPYNEMIGKQRILILTTLKISVEVSILYPKI